MEPSQKGGESPLSPLKILTAINFNQVSVWLYFTKEGPLGRLLSQVHSFISVLGHWESTKLLSNCQISYNDSSLPMADAVIFHLHKVNHQ